MQFSAGRNIFKEIYEFGDPTFVAVFCWFEQKQLVKIFSLHGIDVPSSK